MLPIGHKHLFRNRWLALLWAAGICWSAVSFVGSDSPDNADGNVTAVDQAATEQQVAEAQALIAKLQH